MNKWIAMLGSVCLACAVGAAQAEQQPKKSRSAERKAPKPAQPAKKASGADRPSESISLNKKRPPTKADRQGITENGTNSQGTEAD